MISKRASYAVNLSGGPQIQDKPSFLTSRVCEAFVNAFPLARVVFPTHLNVSQHRAHVFFSNGKSAGNVIRAGIARAGY